VRKTSIFVDFCKSLYFFFGFYIIFVGINLVYTDTCYGVLGKLEMDKVQDFFFVFVGFYDFYWV
jgi:hypothetical protein